MFFSGTLLLFYDPTDVGNEISSSSAFSQSSLHIWKFTVHVLLKPGLENFEHYFTSLWDKGNCEVVWTFFGISFLWDCNENWPFPVLWPLLSFPNSLAYRVQSAAGILSSAGILSAAYWVHGITQAGMLEWFAISSSRDLPNPGIELRSPDLAGRFFNTK